MSDNIFAKLLEEFHEDAYRWALNQCGYNERLAEDVLQDSYEKALKNFKTLNDQKAFKSWLFQIIKTTTIDHFRKDKSNNQNEYSDEDFSKSSTQLKRVQNKRSAEFAGEIIETLSKREKEVIELVVYCDMTLKEAAAVMGVTEGSVSSYYKRAKKALRGEVLKARQANAPDFEQTITHLLQKKIA